MNETNQSCKCTDEGYSVDCPNVFKQGDKWLHSLDNEQQLKPRRYDQGPAQQSDSVSPQSQVLIPIEREIRTTARCFDPQQYWGGSTANNEDHILPGLGMARNEMVVRPTEADLAIRPLNPKPIASTKMVDANTLQQQNRQAMRKYEALNLGGNFLTDVAIGGFEIDLSKAAEKIRAIAPLPPAKLPKIYVDQELNFLHHFFQGLDRLMGREQISEIVNANRHFSTSELVVLPIIEDIIKVGYETKDTNLIVFTKTVLSSTFECDNRASNEDPDRNLLVASNIWGFQYIEDGLECRESDLRMWLTINYNHFKNVYFNNMKDSGVPEFAMDGVQRRYEPLRSELPSTRIYRDETEAKYKLEHRKTYSEGQTRPHRSRRARQPEQSIASKFFGQRG
jgi:hypothetical protein